VPVALQVARRAKVLWGQEQHGAVRLVHDSPAHTPKGSQTVEPTTAHHHKGSPCALGLLHDHTSRVSGLDSHLTSAIEGELQPAGLLIYAMRLRA